MKKYIVHYELSPICYSCCNERVANWMLVQGEDTDGEEFELYAEYDVTDEPTDEDGNLIDEDAGYNELVQEIIEQAKAYGISSSALVFPYGEKI